VGHLLKEVSMSLHPSAHVAAGHAFPGTPGACPVSRHRPAARQVATRPGFTNLSRHARLRVQQRTSLSDSQVLRLIEQGLCVRTGIAPASNREHLAFYSEPDDTVFVAIHDYLYGRLITVLPLDYHRNLAWEVSEEDRARAKALVVEAAERARREEAQRQRRAAQAAAPAVKRPQTVFVVSATFEIDGRFKTTVLSREPVGDYTSVEDFVRRCPVLDTLEDLARAKGLDPSAIVTLLIRHGSKADPVVFAVRG
jgi:hypothetical protein